MKTSLILASIAWLALPAIAQQKETTSLPAPKQWNNFQIVDISPDGQYAFSDRYGETAIINITDGTAEVFGGTADPDHKLKSGYGHLFSTTGVVIANNYYPDAPFYYKDGEWHSLNVPHPELAAMANSITPDGKIIVGYVGMPAAKEGETPTPSLVPAIWTLQTDGTYSDAKVLPWPEKDLTGRLPQYVMGLAISDDGKSIGSIYTDKAGQMYIPLLYTLDDAGAWSYKVIGANLLNQDNVELIPFPDDFTDPMPKMTDYMTEQELADYQKAYDDWMAAGTWDFSTMPTYEQYMTEEELEDYNDAKFDWDLNQKEWRIKYDKAMEAYNKMKDCSVTASLNTLYMSPDGKRATTSGRLTVPLEVPTAWASTEVVNVPLIYNLEDNTSKLYSDFRKCTITGIDKDYNVYALQTIGSYNNPPSYTAAFVCRGGDSEFVSFYDYVNSMNVEAGEWVKENLYHDMQITVDGESQTVNIPITGKPRAAADGSVISCTTSVTWNDEELKGEGVTTLSYTVPLYINTGVKNILAEEMSLKNLGEGRIMVSENVAELMIYDLSGQVVFKCVPGSNIISTGLENGIYVVKAVAANGEIASIKAVL